MATPADFRSTGIDLDQRINSHDHLRSIAAASRKLSGDPAGPSYAGRLLQQSGPAVAIALGALWGWLPCGLVYAMLTAAAFSGESLEGAA